ncbi:MAG: hypothetical protein HQK97_06790 [Nitrospirae bacterium]|nr:hypothetical protein [Nitrospirota bacterium]
MLSVIDEKIKADFCEKNIKVYLTKTRIKSSESAFLKIKKDNGRTGLTDIKDYAGYRILCFFEQDIVRVHEYIYDTFSKDRKFQLIEIKVFNWAKFYDSIKPSATDGLYITNRLKGSGYKSVHYILECDDGQHYIEIQLRTLVQDVWGELEHHMAYKQGNVNEHINDSFVLLAKRLETIDNLLSNLNDIKEKEHKMRMFALGLRGPTFYLDYEANILPEFFSHNVDAKKAFIEYEMHCKSIGSNAKKVWYDKAKALYDELEHFTHDRLADRVNKADTVERAKITYLLEMERAFLHFYEGELDKATDIYNSKEIQRYSDRYVVNFRLGEISFIQGNIEIALEYFDRCEDILDDNSGNTANTTGISNHRNRYDVKRKLSTIYWLLGQEYIDICVFRRNRPPVPVMSTT